MPPTAALSCPALGIRLESSETRHSPGDVVTGCIYRTMPTVAPHARLTVTLHGRSESWMITTRGRGLRDFCGQFNLFDPRTTTQVLHLDKPLHIEPNGGGTSWPFAVTIPSRVDYETLTSARISQKHSFLPLDPDEVATQPIPSVFRSRGFRTGIAAFVEYVLEAELQLSTRGKTKTTRAVLPLQIQQFLPEPPITNFLPQRHSYNRRIISQRLVPGLKDSELSFSQMAQQFIGSSKLPNFVFQVHIELPTVLQLENMNHMPLRIGIEPMWDRTTEIIRGVPQQIKIDSFLVRLGPSINIKCGDWKACDSQEVDLIASDAVRATGEDVYMSWGTTMAADSKSEPQPEFIDVGKLLDFRLGRQSLAHLYPSFTTYNIKQTHQLSWELRGVFADDKIKMISSHEVTVLPRSCPRYGMPPAEEDPPPSFAESQMTRGALNIA